MRVCKTTAKASKGQILLEALVSLKLWLLALSALSALSVFVGAKCLAQLEAYAKARALLYQEPVECQASRHWPRAKWLKAEFNCLDSATVEVHVFFAGKKLFTETLTLEASTKRVSL